MSSDQRQDTPQIRLRRAGRGCWAGVRAALVLLLVAGAGFAPRRVEPASAAAPPACSLPRTLRVPGGTPLALALDPAAHLLIVATPAGLDLLDSCTGRLKTRVNAGGPPSQLAVDARAGRALVLVTPLVRLFDTHRLRWLSNVSLPENAYPKQIVMADGTHEALILDPGTATLWVADMQSGKTVHHVSALPGTQYALAADAALHRAYVTSVGTNTVGIVDTLHWNVLRTTAVGVWPLALAVSNRTGRVFVANRDGKSVSMLDAAGGRLLRTIALPAKPQTIAIDEHMGRVYVALQGSGNGRQARQVVLDAATGAALKAGSAGPPALALAVDPGTGTMFYLEPATGAITILSPTHAVPSATARPAATMHATSTPTATRRPTSTRVVKPSATRTPTTVPSPTSTFTPVPTFTPQPTSTFTPVPTFTSTPTSTPTPLPTLTPTFTSTPTTTPSRTATATPTSTPVPVIVNSGSITLNRGGAAFSFDSGSVVGNTSGDVWWDASFTPMSGATITNLGLVDFDSLTPAMLLKLPYDRSAIVARDDATNPLATGDVFAVHTSQGNYAKAQVQSFGQDIQIRWVTYS